MSYKQFVKNIYPNAYLEVSDSKCYLDIYRVNRIDDCGFHHVIGIGLSYKSAWNDAYKDIKSEMLYKLEQ